MGEIPAIRLEALCKTYGNVPAVHNIDLDVPTGAFIVLLGPSGSGKTTLLSMIGGFTDPDAGRISIDGADMSGVPPARRPTATVFQDYALFPHMNVAANIGFGLEMRGMDRRTRHRLVEETLAVVGLAGFGDRGVHQLSGGQKQRVAVARAIVVRPKIVLLDEPLGALDLNLRRQMQQELAHLQKSLGITFIHVTHDQEEAMNLADSIVLMRAGRIEDRGPPERIYRKPASRFAATFMGDSNIVAARVRGAGEHGLVLETAFGILQAPGLASAGSSVHLSMRPEQLRLGRGENPLGRMRIEESTFLGGYRRCRLLPLDVSGPPLFIRLPIETEVRSGEVIEVHVRGEDIAVIEDREEQRP